MKSTNKPYRVLYIGYWDADDGLTSSTILPNLAMLSALHNVEALYFANVQRTLVSANRRAELEEIVDGYYPLESSRRQNIATRISDAIGFQSALRKLCRELRINYIIARGAPAGALAWSAYRRTGVPYAVESFEPHADYMRFTNTWKPYDPRYIFQRRWERKQKLTADQLIVVSGKYREQLLKEGIQRERIEVVPCGVDPSLFFPDEYLRRQYRKLIGIPAKAIVGVYAGKFGGLYEEGKAFEIFRACFESIHDFFLLIMTPQDKDEIERKLIGQNIDARRTRVMHAQHAKMNNYLNVANFAFAIYKSTPVSRYLSPVKIAEYWAVGLPVLTTEHIGDESDFIEEEKLGIVYQRNIEVATITTMADPLRIRKKGLALRSFENVLNSYKKILV